MDLIGEMEISAEPESSTKFHTLVNTSKGEIPDILINHYYELKPKTQSEYATMLILVSVMDSGYDLLDGSIPLSWRKNVATFKLCHHHLKDFKFELVIVEMGPVKQILASFEKQESEIVMKIKMSDYISASDSLSLDSIKNIDQFVLNIKNNFILPIQINAHKIFDIPAPWHLSGLPFDDMLNILKYLSVKDILNLALTCKALNAVMNNDQIWFRLYKRDFKESNLAITDSLNWKNKYKSEYLTHLKYEKEFEEQQSRKNQMPGPFGIPQIPRPFLGPSIPGPFGPHIPSPGFPNPMNPYGPTPEMFPQLPNPFSDPDNPSFMGDIPPPQMPFARRQPRGPRFNFF